jgi:Glyoxalase-like domain
MTNDANRRLPQGEEIFLDHVGHFVREPQSASRALARAGFSPTPVSVQVDSAGAPTGTGNVTAMFDRGYVEVLFKTADTEIGRELEASLVLHAGVHLAAFSVTDAERAHARLADAGFKMRPLVNFSRPVGTETGKGIAAFTVVRVERGVMPEGRIQILAHQTQDTVWQKRWLDHPNGAIGLLDLAIVVSNEVEATARFARFTDRTMVSSRFGSEVILDRGRVQIVTAQAIRALFPEIEIPSLPFQGAYGIAVRSLAATEAILRKGDLATRRLGKALVVNFPIELGAGAWLFVEQADDLPWRG